MKLLTPMYIFLERTKNESYTYVLLSRREITKAQRYVIYTVRLDLSNHFSKVDYNPLYGP